LKRGGREAVRSCWISRGVQPELLIVDPNHRFVERDLIRRSTKFGLYLGFLDPIVDRFPTPVDTQRVKEIDGIR